MSWFDFLDWFFIPSFSKNRIIFSVNSVSSSSYIRHTKPIYSAMQWPVDLSYTWFLMPPVYTWYKMQISA